MSFQATLRQTGGVTVIDISGPITYSEAGALREMLCDLLNKGQKKILLNLDHVTHLDSSGIGEFVEGYTTIKGNGGQLKLLHLNKQVQRLLQITNLCKVFEDYSDEQTALGSFL